MVPQVHLIRVQIFCIGEKLIDSAELSGADLSGEMHLQLAASRQR
jgi:hypothetical protein